MGKFGTFQDGIVGERRSIVPDLFLQAAPDFMPVPVSARRKMIANRLPTNERREPVNEVELSGHSSIVGASPDEAQGNVRC